MCHWLGSLVTQHDGFQQVPQQEANCGTPKGTALFPSLGLGLVCSFAFKATADKKRRPIHVPDVSDIWFNNIALQPPEKKPLTCAVMVVPAICNNATSNNHIMIICQIIIMGCLDFAILAPLLHQAIQHKRKMTADSAQSNDALLVQEP